MSRCRIATIGVFATVLLGTGVQTAAAQSGSTAAQTIAAMNALWGAHPGLRANHAKGVVVEGTFAPTAAGAALSTASLFAGKAMPVTVRFSDSTGLPAVPDGSGTANPHGMAMKFHPEGGGEIDVVTVSIPVFPVATGEAFRDLLLALGASPPDAPHPTKADLFMAAHPSVPKAFGLAATPSSFAREAYFGVDAFVFVDAAGNRQPFRFQIIPVAGVDHLSVAEGLRQKPDFLLEELPQRLARAPVAFRMMAQLANPGDQTRDPTQAWPADRRLVELGTLTLTTPAADNTAAQHALYYLPNRLAPGIEVSDDPLIESRVEAYVLSFGHRAR